MWHVSTPCIPNHHVLRYSPSGMPCNTPGDCVNFDLPDSEYVEVQSIGGPTFMLVYKGASSDGPLPVPLSGRILHSWNRVRSTLDDLSANRYSFLSLWPHTVSVNQSSPDSSPYIRLQVSATALRTAWQVSAQEGYEHLVVELPIIPHADTLVFDAAMDWLYDVRQACIGASLHLVFLDSDDPTRLPRLESCDLSRADFTRSGWGYLQMCFKSSRPETVYVIHEWTMDACTAEMTYPRVKKYVCYADTPSNELSSTHGMILRLALLARTPSGSHVKSNTIMIWDPARGCPSVELRF